MFEGCNEIKYFELRLLSSSSSHLMMSYLGSLHGFKLTVNALAFC